MVNTKRVLIISPYFPPSNAADMQRLRISLNYYKNFGWQPEVVTIDPVYSDFPKDTLLLETIPPEIQVHYVKALPKGLTSKVGLGSIALRSLWFYRTKVDELLRSNAFDLIYFTTTQFAVCILGSYWKEKFKVPYVIDMQDPWHSEFYFNKPRNERPPKYWFSYRLNKLLEPIAMKNVDGIISVSDAYISTLKVRYPQTAAIPSKTITFGYFEQDLEVIKKKPEKINDILQISDNSLNIVYIGRGGYDMHPALSLLFSAFAFLLKSDYKKFSRFRFNFIGTSYAPKGMGIKTIYPLAIKHNIQEYVNEITDRVSFYESLKCLQQADALIIPGSNDTAYTASKIYPYILCKKPLLGIFNPSSSTFKIINETKAGVVADLNDSNASEVIKKFLSYIATNLTPPATNWEVFEKYNASNLTKEQCSLFDLVIKNYDAKT